MDLYAQSNDHIEGLQRCLCVIQEITGAQAIWPVVLQRALQSTEEYDEPAKEHEKALLHKWDAEFQTASARAIALWEAEAVRCEETCARCSNHPDSAVATNIALAVDLDSDANPDADPDANVDFAEEAYTQDRLLVRVRALLALVPLRSLPNVQRASAQLELLGTFCRTSAHGVDALDVMEMNPEFSRCFITRSLFHVACTEAIRGGQLRTLSALLARMSLVEHEDIFYLGRTSPAIQSLFDGSRFMWGANSFAAGCIFVSAKLNRLAILSMLLRVSGYTTDSTQSKIMANMMFELLNWAVRLDHVHLVRVLCRHFVVGSNMSGFLPLDIRSKKHLLMHNLHNALNCNAKRVLRFITSYMGKNVQGLIDMLMNKTGVAASLVTELNACKDTWLTPCDSETWHVWQLKYRLEQECGLFPSTLYSEMQDLVKRNVGDSRVWMLMHAVRNFYWFDTMSRLPSSRQLLLWTLQQPFAADVLLHKRVVKKLLEYRNVNLLKLVFADARWVPAANIWSTALWNTSLLRVVPCIKQIDDLLFSDARVVPIVDFRFSGYRNFRSDLLWDVSIETYLHSYNSPQAQSVCTARAAASRASRGHAGRRNALAARARLDVYIKCLSDCISAEHKTN
jgi:hypothetical protein